MVCWLRRGSPLLRERLASGPDLPVHDMPLRPGAPGAPAAPHGQRTAGFGRLRPTRRRSAHPGRARSGRMHATRIDLRIRPLIRPASVDVTSVSVMLFAKKKGISPRKKILIQSNSGVHCARTRLNELRLPHQQHISSAAPAAMFSAPTARKIESRLLIGEGTIGEAYHDRLGNRTAPARTAASTRSSYAAQP